VFAGLREQAAKLGWRALGAAAFVDECEKVRGTGGEREGLLREVQMAEWRGLFAWCWGKARDGQTEASG
jgi:hypothetical protein